MRRSGDGSIGEPTWSRKWPSRTEWAHPPERLHSQDRGPGPQDVPVRVLNATRRDQRLTKISPLAHTLVTLLGVEQPQVQDIPASYRA
jgi:hypothetical protein